MDMKKILQAIDGASTKPVEGTSDMKRFVSIIQDSNKEQQVLNEGANPHKVSLPVQMAMQHYQKPVAKKPARPALIDKYFEQVQEEQLQEKKERRQLINQYAQTIAERVMMREGKGEGKWHTSPSGVKTNMPPSDDDYEINYGKHGAAALDEVSKETLKSYVKKNKEDTVQRASGDSYRSGAAGDKYNKADFTHKDQQREKGMDRALNKLAKENFNPQLSDNPMFHPGPGGPGLMPNEGHDEIDSVSLDIPLLIRLLEYAREDAKDDLVIHDMAENMINLCASGKTLGMDDYNKIVPSDDIDQSLPENRAIKPKKKSDPCWSNYHQVGMKKKDGKTVPNCVPKGKQVNELSSEKLGQYKAAASKSASAADKAGDFETGNKRFKGIVKATNKQFSNDLKKHSGK